MRSLPADLHLIAIVSSIDVACAVIDAATLVPLVRILLMLRDLQHQPELCRALADGVSHLPRPANLMIGVNMIHDRDLDVHHLPFAQLMDEQVLCNTVVGTSVHSIQEARAASARQVDYMVAGPIFPTSSKPGHPGIGTAGLADIIEQVSCPVYAIGGMTLERIPEVVAVGAQGIAAVSMFEASHAPSLASRFTAVDDAVRSARAEFHSRTNPVV